MNLIEFEKIFRSEIAPLYINHQNSFDADGIHGCLHISRSLVICRMLACKLIELGYEIDLDKITYAVAFHDSGRKGNGIDYWENSSREICYNYILSKGYDSFYAESISNMIVKNQNTIKDYNYSCLFDSDVLEIMRPSCGVGVYNFNKSYLRLNNVLTDYDSIINEIIPFILETEQEKLIYSDENSLKNIIDYIVTNKEKYPNLYVSVNS